MSRLLRLGKTRYAPQRIYYLITAYHSGCVRMLSCKLVVLVLRSKFGSYLPPSSSRVLFFFFFSIILIDFKSWARFCAAQDPVASCSGGQIDLATTCLEYLVLLFAERYCAHTCLTYPSGYHFWRQALRVNHLSVNSLEAFRL